MRPANTKPLSRHRAGTRLMVRLTPFPGGKPCPTGWLDEAPADVELFLVVNPHFTTRHWATTEPFRDATTLEHFVDDYRKDGLPERRARVIEGAALEHLVRDVDQGTHLGHSRCDPGWR